MKDDSDLVARATIAYERSVRRLGGVAQKPSSASAQVTHEGRRFVVVRHARGVLAVYRVRPDNGILRRMKRWPIAIESLTK